MNNMPAIADQSPNPNLGLDNKKDSDPCSMTGVGVIATLRCFVAGAGFEPATSGLWPWVQVHNLLLGAILAKYRWRWLLTQALAPNACTASNASSASRTVSPDQADTCSLEFAGNDAS